jgi:OOP family OmpA-OmpF porin
MSAKYMIAASFLLFAPAASAQAGPTATKSPEQITCELTGDCQATDPSLATRNADETRGFTLRRRSASQPETQVSAPQRAASTPVSSYSRNSRATAPGQRMAPVRAASSAGVGHSNLKVGFALASATLDPQGLAQANNLLISLKSPKLAGRRVLVSGHTDAIGNREYNLDLSKRRASAVVDYLVAHGVDRNLLEARGYGFDRPLAGSSPKSAANRRVEIDLAN